METSLENLQALAAGLPPSLPLKLLVVADCGAQEVGAPMGVTASGVGGLISSLKPALRFSVENKLQKGGQKIAIDLEIDRLEDFEPASLLTRIGPLSEAVHSGNAAVGEQLDEILHHPEFQRVESCWLGMDRVCKTVAGKKSVILEILPAVRKNLKETFHKKIFEPEYQSQVDVPLSAVFFDYRFSHEPADLPLLEALAADCAALQAPMIAAVSPLFFQLKNLAHLPNIPDLAEKLHSQPYASWRRFQTSDVARWVCLTANRFLARESRALTRDTGAALDYREKSDPAHPEWHLWADAGWLVLCNLARSFDKYRHCVAIDGMGPDAAHFNLPVRPYPKKANVMVPSPSEILVDDHKALELVRGGISMLVGISDGAVATFPLIANVFRQRPGVLTTESALSYQLIAGHLSHFLMSIYGEIPVDRGEQEIVDFLKDKLHQFLFPFTGDQIGENVSIEWKEVKGEATERQLSLTLKPLLKLQGKDVDFTIQLAL